MIYERWRAEVVSLKTGTPGVDKLIIETNNQFWHRFTSGQGAYLIPIIDGIPVVHKFIIVPSEYMYRTELPAGAAQDGK